MVCVTPEEREQFNADVHQALETITPKIAGELIGGHWRGAITGSWFAGLKRYTELRNQIGGLRVATASAAKRPTRPPDNRWPD